MATKKILVIDDDPDVQDILCDALREKGYEVFPALDAMQGSMQARQLKPDLVILDIMMPAGGGQSVYNRLRQSAATMSIPVLVYSAVAADRIREHVPGLPSDRILSKPLPLNELAAAVERVIGRPAA